MGSRVIFQSKQIVITQILDLEVFKPGLIRLLKYNSCLSILTGL